MRAIFFTALLCFAAGYATGHMDGLAIADHAIHRFAIELDGVR